MMNRGGMWIGTLAAILGDRYVETDRFVSIGSGTSGTVTPPSGSTITLDAFGGALDAVVSTISNGKYTDISAKDAAGNIIATTFDAGGNWVFSGTPSAYPVAIIYHVIQPLLTFDPTDTDIVGSFDLENVDGATNLGATGSSVFSSLNGSKLEFRKLIGSTGLTLTQNTNDITFDLDAALVLWASQSTHSVTNGQAATDLSGESFDGAVYSSVVFETEILRGTTVLHTGTISMHYRDSTWRFVQGGFRSDNAVVNGVTFSITQVGAVGQLKAALDSGAGNGKIKFRKIRFAV